MVGSMMGRWRSGTETSCMAANWAVLTSVPGLVLTARSVWGPVVESNIGVSADSSLHSLCCPGRSAQLSSEEPPQGPAGIPSLLCPAEFLPFRSDPTRPDGLFRQHEAGRQSGGARRGRCVATPLGRPDRPQPMWRFSDPWRVATAYSPTPNSSGEQTVCVVDSATSRLTAWHGACLCFSVTHAPPCMPCRAPRSQASAHPAAPYANCACRGRAHR